MHNKLCCIFHKRKQREQIVTCSLSSPLDGTAIALLVSCRRSGRKKTTWACHSYFQWEKTHLYLRPCGTWNILKATEKTLHNRSISYKYSRHKDAFCTTKGTLVNRVWDFFFWVLTKTFKNAHLFALMNRQWRSQMTGHGYRNRFTLRHHLNRRRGLKQLASTYYKTITENVNVLQSDPQLLCC